ncbi:MAG: TIGR00366 family protein [Pirellulaceae bacterium]|nr:short-chain fatty acid transporter [Planctomycetaceae bacterium]MDG1806688.1 TIGR00366 family protein [Pirellulaceae bacterium]
MKSLLTTADTVLRRYTPDPFVIALLLTVATFALAVMGTDSQPLETVQWWGSGFWGLAEFTLKMAMILLTGYVVAKSPPVQWFLLSLIKHVKTPTQAVLFCTFAAMIASWINWGFGLVVGGVVALEVAKRVPAAPFRVLVAASYSGFLVWHAGLSGSIPLALNTETDKITQELVGFTVPLSQTTFGTVNLIALASIVILLPTVNWCMLKFVGKEQTASDIETRPAVPASVENQELSTWLERSFLLAGLVGGLGLLFLASTLFDGTFRLNLDSVMFVFFIAGLLLHGSPRAFIESVQEAVPKIAPILIQYPLYAGIMALLVKTGLASQMSEYFVSVANADTLPLMTFYSAGLVNLFVPSGGGQWAVQAPVVLPAVEQLGADLDKTIMAVVWGDAWTNMLQPFWAVPLLSIAGMRIKDIIGLLLVVLISSGVVLSALFLML